MIESIANGQVKKILKIKKSARFRRQEKCFLVEGFKMVEEALRYKKVKVIYVSEEVKSDWYEKMTEQCKESAVSIEKVSTSVFRHISDTETPQGVLALVEMPWYDSDLLKKTEEAALICLEDIQDPGNLGTIIRTAEGAGMTAVVMTKGCVDIFNPKVVRSTMGAMFRMPFYVVDSMAEEVRKLQKLGFVVYSSQLDGSRVFTECDYKGNVGILIGNEANGICPETAEAADQKIHIPMQGEVESLNAAVSAALLMYEVSRNRAK